MQSWFTFEDQKFFTSGSFIDIRSEHSPYRLKYGLLSKLYWLSTTELMDLGKN